MKVESTHFIPLADAALEDQQLQDSLKRLSGRLANGRTAEVASVPEFDRMRLDARDIKNHTLEHLDLYLEEFETRVQEQGGTVHWAKDDEQARQIVLDLCRAVGAKRITKVNRW